MFGSLLLASRNRFSWAKSGFKRNPVIIVNELASEKYADLKIKFSKRAHIHEFILNMYPEIWFPYHRQLLTVAKDLHKMNLN